MGRRRERCFECNKKRHVSKMVEREYPSKIPGKKVYVRLICKMCNFNIKERERIKEKHDTDLNAYRETVKAQQEADLKAKAEAEKKAKEIPKPKPETIYEPYPVSIRTDEKMQGYLHQKKVMVVPKNLQEGGYVVIDIARLPNQIKQQLGNAVLNFVRKETGALCYEVTIDMLGFQYKVKHTKPKIKEVQAEGVSPK